LSSDYGNRITGGALAGKKHLLYGLGPNPVAGGKKCLLFSIFAIFFQNSQNCRQTLPHPVEVFSMLPNPSKCHVRPKIKNSRMFTIKLKIP